jgi:hypothetical protein
LTVRHICPRGHWAFAPLQRQRPVVLAGLGEQLVVADTDSQVKPGSQAVLHPPQFASFVEMFTHVPSQQRFAGFAPHEAPFARCG